MLFSPWQTALAVVAISLALWGCVSPPPARSGVDLPGEPQLLSGEALFGEAIAATELPDADIRGLDADMRDFVRETVAGANSQEARLARLLDAMLRHGMFSLDYEGEATLTAREMFHSGAGNCLAFTNLFVALAREARLRVSYQQVQIPAMWTGDGDTAILNQHVNVRVRDTTDGRYPPRHQVVDFNLPYFRGRYPERPISDSHVDALYYNNLGASAMRSGDDRKAFVYLLKAITTDRDVAAAWTNLGVLYWRHDLRDHAEGAFQQGLRADPRYKPAMSNLARLYEQRGLHSLAGDYRDRIRRYQLGNPYYHLFLAEQAYAAGRPHQALTAIDQAIRLRKDEHRFHYVRSVILMQIGRTEASRASLERARDYSSVAQLEEIYERKLDELY